MPLIFEYLTPSGYRDDADRAAYANVLDAVNRGGDLRVTTWILDSMTSTFLMLAFANACDECDDADMPHPDKPGPGGNFADHPEPTPEVRAEAERAAVALYAAILAAPGGYDPAPALMRWEESNEVGQYWKQDARGRRPADARWSLYGAARCWGHYAVMEAMGHGVAWSDSNEPLTGPRYVVEGFEVWDITSRREGPMGAWAHEPGRAADFARMWNERDGAADLPSVFELLVSAEDVTWSDAPTDAARAVLDERDARIDAARAEADEDEARAERAAARKRTDGEG